jgi:hypothetical protein
MRISRTEVYSPILLQLNAFNTPKQLMLSGIFTEMKEKKGKMRLVYFLQTYAVSNTSVTQIPSSEAVSSTVSTALTSVASVPVTVTLLL